MEGGGREMQLQAGSPAGRQHGNAVGIRSERHRTERVSHYPSLSTSRVSPDGDNATVAPGFQPRQRRKFHAPAICCIDDTYSDMLWVGAGRIEHSVLPAGDCPAPRECRAAGFNSALRPDERPSAGAPNLLRRFSDRRSDVDRFRSRGLRLWGNCDRDGFSGRTGRKSVNSRCGPARARSFAPSRYRPCPVRPIEREIRAGASCGRTRMLPGGSRRKRR